MALLWMDGFDHYDTGGTGKLNMLAGVWAEAPGGSGPDAAHARTGSYGYSMIGGLLRRIFGGPRQTSGVGYALYLSILPTSNLQCKLFSYRNNANCEQVIIFASTTGGISAYRQDYSSPSLANGGTTTTRALLGTSTDGRLVTGAWQHVESRAYIHATNGAIEVRVDGATVLSLTGVNTAGITFALEASQIGIDHSNSSQTWIDDCFAWDDTGGGATDFVGDCRVRTLLPTGNEATQEWTPNTGAAWDAINDTAPDGDTTYLLADPVGSSPPYTTSEFTLADLPSTVSSIVAVETYTMAKKTDAGVANLQTSLVSGSYVSNGLDRPITTTYTYWNDVHEVDPATGAPWTRSGANAAKLRIRRTAE